LKIIFFFPNFSNKKLKDGTNEDDLSALILKIVQNCSDIRSAIAAGNVDLKVCLFFFSFMFLCFPFIHVSLSPMFVFYSFMSLLFLDFTHDSLFSIMIVFYSLMFSKNKQT